MINVCLGMIWSITWIGASGIGVSGIILLFVRSDDSGIM